MKAPTTHDETKALNPESRKSGYKRIFDLGPEKVAVLNSFLISESMAMEKIIAMVQNEWGYWQGCKPESLRRQLIRYKNDYILPKQSQIAAKLTKDENVQKLAAAVTQIEQNLDSVKTLEWAIQIQIDRVRKMKEQEDKLPTVIDSQTKQLQLLTVQLKELASIQLNIGVLKRVPAQVQLSAELTEEELRFAEKAKLHEVEAAATLEAVRYLRQQGLLGLPPASEREVDVTPQEEARHDEGPEGDVVSGDDDP